MTGNIKVIRSISLMQQKASLDDFLREGKKYKDIPLVLTADRQSMRSTYRGLTIRQWHHAGITNYDTAVELLGD